jgi:chromate reductase, NAD(P)H dehydrogenase (quinone)
MNGAYPIKKSPIILGIVGSLRTSSFNGALLNATKNLLPDSVEFGTFDLNAMPHYNQDVEDSGIPTIVSEFRSKVRHADVIILAAPEYNGSVSGVLKDALDWASRPYGDGSISGKPVAVLTAVSGRNGGSAVLNHLAQILDYLDARLVGEPVLLQQASRKFDDQSDMIDPKTISQLEKLVARILEEPSMQTKTLEAREEAHTSQSFAVPVEAYVNQSRN